MEIKNVNIIKIEKENSRIRGIASVVLDDCFVIKDIRIIEGEKGLFLSFPNRKKANGQYKDIVHPLNQETRTLFEKVIIEEYKKGVEK